MSMQMPMPFTVEQYDQILKMLQKDNMHESTANAANAAGINGPPMLANAVSVTHSTDSKAKDDKWIVDKGATDHMVSNRKIISKPKEHSKSIGGKVHLPNVGSSELDQGIISNVLCIPGFKYNLLSVSKLTRELNCCMLFFPDPHAGHSHWESEGDW
ncbi:hypothetical protein A4A49_01418 [Nicotiana attenuata]|uniref:Retrovirus-related Pol polyprotein from transposon TNT 1-94-like beta-barrel domain-containing protein n=1 Tax=Nicotiana attenuata TaxID=49451 RepID=A0A1J6IPQ6_NICAT|nr:hypothetical protein A4A49_01418 [Nicotiana attenuata]